MVIKRGIHIQRVPGNFSVDCLKSKLLAKFTSQLYISGHIFEYSSIKYVTLMYLPARYLRNFSEKDRASSEKDAYWSSNIQIMIFISMWSKTAITEFCIISSSFVLFESASFWNHRISIVWISALLIKTCLAYTIFFINKALHFSQRKRCDDIPEWITLISNNSFNFQFVYQEIISLLNVINLILSAAQINYSL